MKFTNLSNVYGSTYEIDNNEPIDAIKSIIKLDEETSSFYHLSVDELLSCVDQWRNLLPRITPHYAIKCNSEPSILRTFSILGMSFDCASRGEIDQILRMGVEPSRIIFASAVKTQSDIKYARAKKINRMTFDNHYELHKTAKHYPGASLLLRLRCDDPNAQCKLGLKFGAMPEETRSLLSLATQLGLRVVGVAFHVGSGCAEPQVFLKAIASAKEVFREAMEEGHTPTVLDIGGGFTKDNFEEAAEYINQALDEHFPEESGVEVIAEPGRYMVSTAFTLATPIMGRRDLLQPDEEGNESMLFIEDGIYGSFNCIFFDHNPVHPKLLSETQDKSMAFKIWGQTCDSIDEVMGSTMLPSQLSVGDWLMWPAMGAYTMSAASGFNGFAKPQVLPYLTIQAEQRLQDLLLESHVSTGDCSETTSGVVSDEETTSEASFY